MRRQLRRVAEGDDAGWFFVGGCGGAALYVFLYNKHIGVMFVFRRDAYAPSRKGQCVDYDT
jgi:hypothetical protein